MIAPMPHGRGAWTCAVRRGAAPGSGTMLNIAVMMIMFCIAGAVAVLARYGLAVHQAQNAADLGALAGAQVTATGADGCQAASRTATANSGRLLSCRMVGDPTDFVLNVRVGVQVVEPVLGMPSTVAREAHAGPVR